MPTALANALCNAPSFSAVEQPLARMKSQNELEFPGYIVIQAIGDEKCKGYPGRIVCMGKKPALCVATNSDHTFSAFKFYFPRLPVGRTVNRLP